MMYRKPILLVLFLLLTTLSCIDNGKKAHAVAQEEEIPNCKIMIILGDDRSGSSQSIQKLNKEDYKAIIDR